MHPTRRGVMRLALPLSAAAVSRAALAQSQPYPNRPVRLVIGYTAGGAVDLLSRLLGQELATRLGQTFIVDNRPGASATIAAEAVARAPADGYTLFVTVPSVFTMVPSMMANLRVRATDFTPAVEFAESPLVLLVNPRLAATTLPALVALMKAPGQPLSYASAGPGTLPHLAMELLIGQAGGQPVHVPYRGSAPALQDLVAGHVQMMFDNLSSSLPMIRDGSLRAIAVTSRNRFPGLPDVPSIAESGLPDYDVANWFGLFAPRGTPEPIISLLRVNAVAAMAAPDVRERLASLGASASQADGTMVQARIVRETERWSAIIGRLNLREG